MQTITKEADLNACRHHTSSFTQFMLQLFNDSIGGNPDEELLRFLVRVLPEEDDLYDLRITKQ